ncbi:DUF2589 domain-containing protein [Streptomyces sp. NPDC003042]
MSTRAVPESGGDTAGGQQDIQVGYLLGAAYHAVVEGQAMAARESVELVRRLGFDEDGNAMPFRFSYQRSEAAENGAGMVARTVHATVPLLTMINPPMMSIDTAEIDMDIAIRQQSGPAPGAPPAPAAVGLPGGTGQVRTPPAAIAGRVASSSRDATLKIRSVLKHRPLLGTGRLSDLLESAVSEHDHHWNDAIRHLDAFKKAAGDLLATVENSPTWQARYKCLPWLWMLRQTVTDAVDAYRDGNPDTIAQQLTSWDYHARNIRWVTRQEEESESYAGARTLAELRRTFLDAAAQVWKSLLPAAAPLEFGPPPVKVLRKRFEDAAEQVHLLTRMSLNSIGRELWYLSGVAAEAETAYSRGLRALAAEQLTTYNTMARALQQQWDKVPGRTELSVAQDELAHAARDLWKALAPDGVPYNFLPGHRVSPEDERSASESLELLDTLCQTLAGVEGAPDLRGALLEAQAAKDAFGTADAETAIQGHLQQFNAHLANATWTARNTPNEQDVGAHIDAWNDAAKDLWELIAPGQYWQLLQFRVSSPQPPTSLAIDEAQR